MNEIFVKVEWLCYDDEIVQFEAADAAVEYAQSKSKNH